MSSQRATRVVAAKMFPPAPKPIKTGKKAAIADIRAALYASKICSYAQGFVLLAEASKSFGYGVKLGEIARIWKGGCIIRAVFLDRITQAFERDPNLANLLLDKDFAKAIKTRARLVAEDGAARRPSSASRCRRCRRRSPTSTASGARRTPANLIQAQRDFFGAHTYERLDRKGIFHTEWSGGEDEQRSRR